MAQGFYINFDKLEASLTMKEGEKWARYDFGLEPDRSGCLVERSLYEYDAEKVSGKGDLIEQKSWYTSLETLGNDAALPHAVMWAARGMWGIPLEFGPKIEETVPGETVSL